MLRGFPPRGIAAPSCKPRQRPIRPLPGALSGGPDPQHPAQCTDYPGASALRENPGQGAPASLLHLVTLKPLVKPRKHALH